MKISPFIQTMAAALMLALFSTSCGQAIEMTPKAATPNSTTTPQTTHTFEPGSTYTPDPYPAKVTAPSATPRPYPLDTITPLATNTITFNPTEPPTATLIPVSWNTFSAPTLKIQFRYPAEWQAEAPLRLSGADGFVEIYLIDYPASLFDVMRTVCVLEANTDRPAAYGVGPLIADWQGWDIEQHSGVGRGCTVRSSDGMPSDRPAQAVLFVRYPPPQMHNQLLVLRADDAHFSGILSTLRFQEYTSPTPSSGYYNSPACGEAKVGPPLEALRTEALIITETAIANKNCDPWQHFDGFQALVNSSGLQAARISAIQNGLTPRRDNSTAWVGADGIGYQYASAPLFPVGSPAQVNITLNGQVVDTLAVAQAGPAGYPVHSFWSWKGHWLLEMDSVVVQDGKLVNNILKYAQIFEWNLMNDEPFFLFQKDSRYGISYAGQELPLRYDDIIHGPLCCDPGVYSIISTPSGAWFYALRGEIWYMVQAQVK